jgi:hypothetical protein
MMVHVLVAKPWRAVSVRQSSGTGLRNQGKNVDVGSGGTVDSTC